MERSNFRILKINLLIFLVLTSLISTANSNKTLDIDKYNVRKFNFSELSSSSNSSDYSQPNDELPIAAAERIELTAFFDKVFGDANFLKDVTIDTLRRITLPVGMKHEKGSLETEWAIVATTFTPEYVLLDMLARITKTDKDGQKHQFLCGAWNVKWYYNTGLKPEEVKFALLKDVVLPMGENGSSITLNGNFDIKNGKADLEKASFIQLDCGGIKDLKGIFRGKVSIDNENGKIKRVESVKDPNGKIDFRDYGSGSIDIPFQTFVSLDDFYFNVLPEEPLFLTYDDTDFIFKLQNIVCDFSSQQSNPSFLQCEYDPSLKNNEWEGLYIQNLSVFFPAAYTSGNGRIEAGFSDFIIDGFGISTIGSVSNLDKIKGYGDWPLVVNSVSIGIHQSSLSEAKIEGFIETPVNVSDGSSSVNEDLKFKASYKNATNGNTTNGNTTNSAIWSVTLSADRDIPLSLWDATILASKPAHEIKDKPYTFGATLEYDKSNNKVAASFNGAIQFEGDVSSLVLGINEFKVGYDLANKKLSLDGKFVYEKDGGSRFDNFPITIGYDSNEEICLSTTGDITKLSVPLKLTLMPDRISAMTTLEFRSEQKTENDRVKWKFKDVDVAGIGIEGYFKVFKLSGTINRFKILNSDGTLKEKGFKGEVVLTIAPSGEVTEGEETQENGCITVTGLANFGTALKSGGGYFDYWSVDIQATGLNVSIGGSAIMTGIGGAAAYRMKREASKKDFTPDPNNGLYLSCNTLLKISSTHPESQAGFEIQFSPNWGVMYVALFSRIELAPKLDKLPGLEKIMAGYEAIAKNGPLEFLDEVNNATAEGLEKINKHLKGKIKILVPETTTSSTEEDPSLNKVQFNLLLHANIAEKELYGSAESYVNIGNIIKGNSPGGEGTDYAGGIYFYFGDDGYFVHMGYRHFDYFNNKTPQRKFELLGLGLKVPVIKLDVDARAYFLMGSSGMMPQSIPSTVDMFGAGFKVPDIISEAFTKVNENAKFGDGGLSFGASLTHELHPNFGIVYADLGAFVGFNVLLQHYENCMCKGNTKYGNDFGINNWYASGMAYAGLDAEVGVRVKIWRIRKDISVLKAGMSAVLMAMLPKPTFFAGTVQGSYAVLNGKVKGSFKLPFSFGDECRIDIANPENQNEEIPLISKIEKEPGPDSEISPLDKPKITFNYDFDTPFQMTDEPSDKLPKFKFVCTGASASYGESYPVEELILSKLAKKNEVEIVFKDPGKRWENYDYGVDIRMQFQLLELKAGATEWGVATGDDGKLLDPMDTLIHYGKIGALPDKLLAGDIMRMYPIMDQKYFFTEQSSEGFIKMRSMGYLFDKSNPIFEVIFKAGSGTEEKRRQASYVTGGDMGGVYTGTLTFEIPDDLSNNATYTVTIVEKVTDQENNTTYDKELFSYQFSTSAYKTFALKVDKMNSFVAMEGQNDPINGRIGSTFEYIEPFDAVELYGSRYYLDDDGTQKPLVTVVPDLPNSEVSECSKYYSVLLDIYDKLDGLRHVNFSIPNYSDVIANMKENTFYCFAENWDEMEKKMIQNSQFPYVFSFSANSNKPSIYEMVSFFNSNYEYIIGNSLSNYRLSDEEKNFLLKYVKSDGKLALPYLPNECDFPIRLNYSIGSDPLKNTGTKTLKYFNQSL